MVTREELLDIALLAKLSVDEEKLDELTKQMMDIIAFADTINAYEGQTGEFDNINGLSNVFRRIRWLLLIPGSRFYKM